jgi:hypothetical protein
MPFDWNNAHADRGRYDDVSVRPGSCYSAEVRASLRAIF